MSNRWGVGPRRVTFENQSSKNILTIIWTENGGGSEIVGQCVKGEDPLYWSIPNNELDVHGNFRAIDKKLIDGVTQAEFGFNVRKVKGIFTDVFNLSIVPPGISASSSDGPRTLCISQSKASGHSCPQNHGFNIGMELIPLNNGFKTTRSRKTSCGDTNYQ